MNVEEFFSCVIGLNLMNVEEFFSCVIHTVIFWIIAVSVFLVDEWLKRKRVSDAE
jgi:hypothetical protein